MSHALQTLKPTLPRQHGFTVVELVVTIAVIGVLAGGSLFFIHEKTYGPELRDAQRFLDIARLTNAVKAYAHDTGALPAGLIATPQVIGSQDGELDWCASLVPKYLKDVPLDPGVGAQLSNGTCAAEGSFYSTGYTAVQAEPGTITIAAPTIESEDNTNISITYKF